MSPTSCKSRATRSWPRSASTTSLTHPFNGRVQPEADNPGQILWVIGEHWKLTRDQDWLNGVYPQAMKLADMIEYYRTQPEPHWVSDTSLEFGTALPENSANASSWGTCDGYQPEYTEAFDIAGIRAAAALAQAVGDNEEVKQWTTLSEKLFDQYHRRFGERLSEEVLLRIRSLWPCRIYPGTTRGPRSSSSRQSVATRKT